MTKYDDFIEAYRLAYPHIRKKLQYEQAIELWNDLKTNPDNFDERFKKKMTDLKFLRAQNNSQSLKSFTQSKLNFGKVPEAQINNKPDKKLPSTSHEGMIETKNKPDPEPERSYETPAQNKLKKEIAALNANLVTKRQMRDSGLSDVTSTELANIRVQIKQKQKALKCKEKHAMYMKECRTKF